MKEFSLSEQEISLLASDRDPQEITSRGAGVIAAELLLNERNRLAECLRNLERAIFLDTGVFSKGIRSHAAQARALLAELNAGVLPPPAR